QITEQVEGLHANVGATDRALQERPEILEPVGVNLALGIALGVVDDLMLKPLLKPLGGHERLREDLSPHQPPIGVLPLKVLPLPPDDHLSLDSARLFLVEPVSFKQSEDDNL